MDDARDEGMTLVELLVAISVSFVLLSALSATLTFGLRSAQFNTQHLSGSQSAQLVQAYMVADAQNAKTMTGIDSAAWPCGAGEPTGLGTSAKKLAVFTWSEVPTTGATTNYAAAYYFTRVTGSTIDPSAATRWQLVRYACSGITLSSVPATTTVTARELADPFGTATEGKATPSGATAQIKMFAYKSRLLKSAYPITFKVFSRTQAYPAGGVVVSPSTPASRKTSMQMLDLGTPVIPGGPPVGVPNGRIDTVKVTYLSGVTPACSDASQWSITHGPSGATLSTVAPALNVFTLTLTEGSGLANTSLTTLTSGDPLTFGVTFAPDPASCALIGFKDEAPLDKAGPVVMSVTTTTPNTVGKVEPNDVLRVEYSEPIKELNAATPRSLALTREGGPNRAGRLAVTGLIAPASPLALNADYFVDNDPASVSFPVTLSRGAATATSLAYLEIKLSGACTPTSECADLGGGTGVLPASTGFNMATPLVTDDLATDPNTAVAAATKTTVRLF